MGNKFKMPTKATLKSRKSTINNAFAISITPWDRPKEEEIEEMYKQLKINPGQCAYCLKDATTTDHLNCLVIDGKPTGYVTEKNNLVPCCSSCNSSKGRKTVDEWYENRLKSLGFDENVIIERKKVIEQYIKKNQPIQLDYKDILGEKDYQEYLKMKQDINEMLDKYQNRCDEFKKRIEDYYNKNIKQKDTF